MQIFRSQSGRYSYLAHLKTAECRYLLFAEFTVTDTSHASRYTDFEKSSACLPLRPVESNGKSDPTTPKHSLSGLGVAVAF